MHIKKLDCAQARRPR